MEIKKLLESLISRSFPSVVRPDRAQIHGWGAAGSKPALLLSSKDVDDRTIPKKNKGWTVFKRCSGTPPGGLT